MSESWQSKISVLKNELAESPSSLVRVQREVEALANVHPSDAWLRAEIGGVFDSNGFEAEACIWYEKALQFGFESFPQEEVPHFCVWYGSTLRNVKRYRDSERVLRSGLNHFPKFSALQFFLALTLMSQGRAMEAIVALADLQTPGWDDSIKVYHRAVESYVNEELKPAAKTLNLGCARMIVRNVVESALWYEKVLGVSASSVLQGFATFRLGCGELELVEADEKNSLSDGGTISYWNTSSLADLIKRFEDNGAVVYRGPLKIEDEGLTICQMRDPFGSIIGLREYHSI